MKKNIPLAIDVVFCVVLLPSMLFLLPIERWYQTNTLFVTLLVTWLYGVYFAYRHAVIPQLFRDRQRLMIALAAVVLMTFVTYLLTRYQLEAPSPRHVARMSMHHPGAHRHRAVSLSRMLQQAVWFLYIMVAAFGSAVGLLTELSRQMMARQSIEFEKNRAELALYKAQINPHFLFNTLNTLYGLMLTDTERAEKAFVQFSDLMRYMYQNVGSDKIPLSTEVDYIRKYIELEKNRMSDKIRVDFDDETASAEAGLEIAPMLLITFVENAFKYGISSSEESVIAIGVGTEGRRLWFRVRNQIMKDAEGSGIGIENCRKRLELLYPGCHRLDITKANNMFNVDLTIDL